MGQGSTFCYYEHRDFANTGSELSSGGGELGGAAAKCISFILGEWGMGPQQRIGVEAASYPNLSLSI